MHKFIIEIVLSLSLAKTFEFNCNPWQPTLVKIFLEIEIQFKKFHSYAYTYIYMHRHMKNKGRAIY